MFTKYRVFGLLLLVVIGITAVSCWRRGPAEGMKIERIVLISIDTCRADYLSCYGYQRKTTPNIDKLAEEGVLFENVISPVPLTLPAHSSMLTGTIPPWHGVHENHDYHLGESNTTLAEILKERGFTTGAIVSAFVLDSQFGLDQGFETYNDQFEKEYKVHNMLSERKADETSRCAGEWLEEHQKEQFFLFLHYFDPHEDYEPPEPFGSSFSRKSNDLRVQLNDAYAGEIAFTDHCIGQVVSKLKELGLYDSTLIILVGDHGELLGEHGEPTHTYYIYQNAIRVPLLFKLPGRHRSTRVSQLTGIIDIVPTVCSLLDIDLLVEVQGIDMSNRIFGNKNPPGDKRYVYCESFRATTYGANPLLGVVTSDNWKYIQTTRPELYYLSTDPAESINLQAQQEQRGRIFQDHLKQLLEQTVRKDKTDSRTELDAKARKRLESLGYVSGGINEDFSFDTCKEDPKDLFGFHLLHQEVIIRIAEKEYVQSKAAAEKMVLQRPDFYPAYRNLATIAMEQGDLPSAAPYLREMVRLKPDDFESCTNLGAISQAQGRLNEASDWYRRAIEIKPDYAAAYNNLANLLMIQGKGEEAVVHLRQALQINPEYSDAHYNLGKALSLTGQKAQAMDHFRQAVRLRPKWPAALNHIAWILATDPDSNIRNSDEAVRFAERASQLTQNRDAAILDTLAAAYAESGRFGEAVKTAEKAMKLAYEANKENLAEEIRKSLKLYRTGRPWRQPPATEGNADP